MKIVQLGTREARQELGFSDTIPKDAERPMTKLSDGLWYVVDRSMATMERDRWGHRISRRPHRVFVQCPLCNKPVPAGRLHQHLPSHGGWRRYWDKELSLKYRHVFIDKEGEYADDHDHRGNADD